MNQEDSHIAFTNRLKLFMKAVNKNQKELAEIAKVSRQAISGYLAGSVPHALVLKRWSSKLHLNINWLLLGEGEMFRGMAPALSALNKQGKLTGDLLRVVLSFAEIGHKDVVEKTSISETRLQELLDSRSLPSFSELEELHTEFGINPAYFFTGNEHTMYQPDDELLLLLYALGKQGHAPTWQMIGNIFDVGKEEAKAFLAEWEEVRSKGESRVLPPSWLDHLYEKYRFNPAWLMSANPPIISEAKPQKDLPNQSSSSAPDRAVIDQLRSEVTLLRQKLENATTERQSLIRTNEHLAELLNQKKMNANKKPAPGAHINIPSSED